MLYESPSIKRAALEGAKPRMKRSIVHHKRASTIMLYFRPTLTFIIMFVPESPGSQEGQEWEGSTQDSASVLFNALFFLLLLLQWLNENVFYSWVTVMLSCGFWLNGKHLMLNTASILYPATKNHWHTTESMPVSCPLSLTGFVPV